MPAVSPALLNLLDLKEGAEVTFTVAVGKLVVEPALKKRYALSDLLAMCAPNSEDSDQVREWLDSGPRGSEVL